MKIHETPKISLNLGNRIGKIPTLVDSGASHTFISKKFIEENVIKTEAETESKLNFGNSTSQNCNQCTYLEIIGDEKVTIKATVADISEKIVLGIDAINLL